MKEHKYLPARYPHILHTHTHTNTHFNYAFLCAHDAYGVTHTSICLCMPVRKSSQDVQPQTGLHPPRPNETWTNYNPVYTARNEYRMWSRKRIHVSVNVKRFHVNVNMRASVYAPIHLAYPSDTQIQLVLTWERICGTITTRSNTLYDIECT